LPHTPPHKKREKKNNTPGHVDLAPVYVFYVFKKKKLKEMLILPV
jgi:hypothetical protein